MANLHFNSISLCLWLNWLPFCIDFSFRYLNPGHYRNTFPFSLWHTSQYAFSGMTDFISLGSKITADGDYNHEIKWCLLLGRKAMTKLGSILKSRDITLLAKVHIVKAIVSPVVMYRSENWTIKKAECQRIDAFELWCWRRLLKVPWTVNPKGIQPWISIGRNDAKAEAPPILWPLDLKSQLIGKDPDDGKDWRQKERVAAEDEMVK